MMKDVLLTQKEFVASILDIRTQLIQSLRMQAKILSHLTKEDYDKIMRDLGAEYVETFEQIVSSIPSDKK